jgi:hypothetical protein
MGGASYCAQSRIDHRLMPAEAKAEAPKAEATKAEAPPQPIPEVQEELMSLTAISDVLSLDEFWPVYLEKKVGRQARSQREWVSILKQNGWGS